MREGEEVIAECVGEEKAKVKKNINKFVTLGNRLYFWHYQSIWRKMGFFQHERSSRNTLSVTHEPPQGAG